MKFEFVFIAGALAWESLSSGQLGLQHLIILLLRMHESEGALARFVVMGFIRVIVGSLSLEMVATGSTAQIN